MKQNFEPVTGYAVVYKRGSIVQDYLMQYDFEKRKNVRPQNALTICVSKAGAARWINKWISIGECEVIPVLITPVSPKKPKPRRTPKSTKRT